jgi:hypothetical protein
MRTRAIALIVSLLLLSALAAGQAKAFHTTGWVSDSVCAAKGDKKCANREHIKQGAKLVIVTDGDNKIWLVKNPAKVADQNTLDVKSIAKAKAAEKQ